MTILRVLVIYAIRYYKTARFALIKTLAKQVSMWSIAACLPPDKSLTIGAMSIKLLIIVGDIHITHYTKRVGWSGVLLKFNCSQ